MNSDNEKAISITTTLENVAQRVQEKVLDKSTISTGLPKCLAFYAKTSDSKTLKIQEFFLDARAKALTFSWILRMDYYRS